MRSMIACVQIPRFELMIAARAERVEAGRPMALAPEPGREPLIGEASASAEGYGVRAGQILLPEGVDWVEATRELRKGFVEHPHLDPSIKGPLN